MKEIMNLNKEAKTPITSYIRLSKIYSMMTKNYVQLKTDPLILCTFDKSNQMVIDPFISINTPHKIKVIIIIVKDVLDDDSRFQLTLKPDDISWISQEIIPAREQGSRNGQR